jgi:peptidoglycan/xylan/chitin deacetylase (PgdA/CDA1 family)
MASLRRLLKPLARQALRAPTAHRVASAAAALRGRQLVLVFHRIIEDGKRSGGVVPAVAEAIFSRQLEQILELGDVVSLASMLAETSVHTRPRFALTFDDDYISHYEVVLPILRRSEVTATFFLGGRSLHGLGPLWFEVLDALLLARGVDDVARRFGIPTRDVQVLTGLCENDRRLQRRLEEEDVAVPGQLGRDHIRALADADMTVGFHTLHHRLLTGLPDDAVDTGLRHGRDELEALVEEPVLLFAYPHGETDGRIAERVRGAGYLAAWTGRPRPIERGSDPYQLGRWEPGVFVGRDFGARVAARLNGWGGT